MGVFRLRQGQGGNTIFMENNQKQIVVVCFGTPTVEGDSFGPRVGSFLCEMNLPCFVYGTLSRPVTARNMQEFECFVERVHSGATVLSVDACLGRKHNVLKYSVRSDGVCPAGIKGEKKRFGDVGILGVVGATGGDNITTLLTANRVDVTKLAYKVAIVIKSAIQSLVF